MNNYKKLDLRLSTWENYDRLIRVHLLPEIGDINFKDLTTDHIQKLYNHTAKNKASTATIRKIHQVIYSALKQAAKNKIISYNPAEAVTLPKTSKREVHSLSQTEMQNFLNVLKTDTYGIAMLTLLGTGLRQGELLALTWNNIDLRNKLITVSQSIMRTKSNGLVFVPPKTEKGKRIIPIPKEVAVVLRFHRIKQSKTTRTLKDFNPNNLVFCSSAGTIIIPRNFTRKFYILREKAKLSNKINLHALRHTYATRLLEHGENLKTIQELLGHAEISTTGNIYTDVLLETKKKAVANIDGLLKKK